jgi:hypothetical protein
MKIIQSNQFIIILLIFLSSCMFKEIRVTGFTKEYYSTQGRLMFLKTIVLEKQVRTSGWFVNLIYKNGRLLNLFVPKKDSINELDLRAVINEVVLSNNPNNWPFYYCIFGVISIDSITNNKGEMVEYNFYQTVIEQNRPFEKKTKKIGRYIVEYVYANSVSFCQGSVEVVEMNKYNSVLPLQDGRSTKSLPKHPFYVFSEQNNRIKILLSKSGLCN